MKLSKKKNAIEISRLKRYQKIILENKKYR